MKSARLFALGLVLLEGACRREPPAPRGEVLVVVDTDLSIPRLASRLRVDAFTEDGRWFESRDYAASEARSWPLSFSVTADDETKERVIRLRLRLYPEGKTRDYRGERAVPRFEPRTFATSIDELCADPPELPLGDVITLRRGPKAITGITKVDGVCDRETRAGSVAAKVVVPTKAKYRFEVSRAVPDGTKFSSGDTTLVIRRACADVFSQIACNDDIEVGGDFVFVTSRVILDLDPGTYFMVTGGFVPVIADLTLRAGRADAWDDKPPSATATPEAEKSAAPRLTIDGADRTPPREPLPGVTIDRLISVRVKPNVRKRARVTLSGECLGAPIDLAKRETCVGGAGAPYVAVTDLALDDTIERAIGDSKIGTFATTSPCKGTPDEHEVCVPGGAFILGDSSRVTEGNFPSAPERTVVLSPFFLDRHEVSVGKYRDALKRGLVSGDATPFRNDKKIDKNARNFESLCTFNRGTGFEPAAGIDRENLPVTCVTWQAARAYCQFEGADLPSEAQWEYAAHHAGFPYPAPFFPWGSDAPDCNRMVFGRGSIVGASASSSAFCRETFGPSPVDALPWADSDRTPLGLVNMMGNVSEWTLDAAYPYDDPAWLAIGLHDPVVVDPNVPMRMSRGAGWFLLSAEGWESIASADRRSFPPIEIHPSIGFRCARPGGA